MQQRMTAFDTEGTNDDINRLADGNAAPAEKPIIRGRSDRQLWARQRHDLVLAERALDELRLRLGAKALQHLAQDQVAHEQRPFRDNGSKTCDGGAGYLVELVNP